MLKGKSLLEDSTALGVAVETAFFKHVVTRYYDRSLAFNYWRGKKDYEGTSSPPLKGGWCLSK